MKPARREFGGGRRADGLRFAVVVSRYHLEITKRLLEGAEEELVAAGAAQVDVAWVPGAFEIPVAAAELARSGRYQGVLCLGCVIRGETRHFELIADSVTAQIARIAVDTGVPCAHEVLAVEHPEQAADRSAPANNRGREAARAAVEMAALLNQLRTREAQEAAR